MASNLLADEEGVGPPLELLCKTLYAWEEAVSPLLATEREGLVPKDSTVLETLGECLNDVAEWGASKERLLVKLPVQDLLARFNVTCIGLCCCNLVLNKNCCQIYLFISGLNMFVLFIFCQAIPYSCRSCWGWEARRHFWNNISL